MEQDTTILIHPGQLSSFRPERVPFRLGGDNLRDCTLIDQSTTSVLTKKTGLPWHEPDQTPVKHLFSQALHQHDQIQIVHHPNCT